jgi:hypothetical protein
MHYNAEFLPASSGMPSAAGLFRSVSIGGCSSSNIRSGLTGRARDSNFLTEIKLSKSKSSLVASVKGIRKDKRFSSNESCDTIKLVKRKKKRFLLAYGSNELKMPNGKKDNQRLARKPKGSKITKSESDPTLETIKRIPISFWNSTGNIGPKLKKWSISKLDTIVTTPKLNEMGVWRINNL